jgi:hypothetical protein
MSGREFSLLFDAWDWSGSKSTWTSIHFSCWIRIRIQVQHLDSNLKQVTYNIFENFPFSKFFVVDIFLFRRTPNFQQFKRLKENLTYFSAKYLILSLEIHIRIRTLLKCRIWIRKQWMRIRNPSWLYSHKYFYILVLVMKTSQNNMKKIF